MGPKQIKDWSLDPQVSYGSTLNPTVKSIYDTLEDMDAKECLNMCKTVGDWRPLKKPRFKKVKNVQPEQKGVNLIVKCVKAPAAVEGRDDIKEVVCGDDTGVVTISLSS